MTNIDLGARYVFQFVAGYPMENGCKLLVNSFEEYGEC